MACTVQLSCASPWDMSIYNSQWLQYKQIYLFLIVTALGREQNMEFGVKQSNCKPKSSTHWLLMTLSFLQLNPLICETVIATASQGGVNKTGGQVP